MLAVSVDGARLFLLGTFCNFLTLCFLLLLFLATSSRTVETSYVQHTHTNSLALILAGADASLRALHWVSRHCKGHYKLQVVSSPLSTVKRTVAQTLSAKNYTADLFALTCVREIVYVFMSFFLFAPISTRPCVLCSCTCRPVNVEGCRISKCVRPVSFYLISLQLYL